MLGNKISIVTGDMPEYDQIVSDFNMTEVVERKKAVEKAKTGKYQLYFYYKEKGEGNYKLNNPKGETLQSFLEAVNGDVAVYVPTGDISVSKELELLTKTVESHSHPWDATAFTHHTGPDGKKKYTDGTLVDSNPFRRFSKLLYPSSGYYLYATCKEKPDKQGFEHYEAVNVKKGNEPYVKESSSENGLGCIIWYMSYAKITVTFIP